MQLDQSDIYWYIIMLLYVQQLSCLITINPTNWRHRSTFTRIHNDLLC